MGREALAIRARINRVLETLFFSENPSMLTAGVPVAISEYLRPQTVLFFKDTGRDEAIRALVEALAKVHPVGDIETFYQAVIEREKLVSTGVGVGVAVPHAKLDNCRQFFVALGIIKGRGVDWKSLDGSLVKLIFLIGGPSNQQKKYLAILSELTALVRESAFREKLLQAYEEKEVVALFKERGF